MWTSTSTYEGTYEIKDKITIAVIDDLASKSERGYKKYNTTLEENNHQNMLQHAYEEALDLAQYLKKEITTLNTIQDLVNQYSNDQELGKAIRDRKSTRLNSSHVSESRMPSSA